MDVLRESVVRARQLIIFTAFPQLMEPQPISVRHYAVAGTMDDTRRTVIVGRRLIDGQSESRPHVVSTESQPSAGNLDYCRWVQRIVHHTEAYCPG